MDTMHKIIKIKIFKASAFICLLNIFFAAIFYNYLGAYKQIAYIDNMKAQLQLEIVKKEIDYKELFARPDNFFSLMLLLKDRVAQNPNDSKGWFLLSKLYKNAQDERNAQIALQRAEKVTV